MPVLVLESKASMYRSSELNVYSVLGLAHGKGHFYRKLPIGKTLSGNLLEPHHKAYAEPYPEPGVFLGIHS